MNLLIATFPLAFGSISDGSVVGTFDAASKAILYWVGNAVLYGSALALLTWALLSTALRRTRPTIHAAFWLLVIAKFLLPIGPGWSYSLSSLVSSLTGWPQPAPLAATETGTTAGGPLSSMTLYLLLSPEAGTATAAPAAMPTAPAKKPPAISISALLVATYLLGLVLIASIRLAAYRRVARSVRKLPAADAATRALVRDVCVRLGQRGVFDVRISEAAPAPYVLGAWRPTLVLSTRNLVSREECEAVVLHELAHLRRHDLLVRYAQWLAGTVLYFWPVVAWVNRRIDLAREAACDEWALRHGRLSPAEYARCLLKCAQPVRSGLTAYAPAAMAANASHVERRIEMILDTQTTPRRSRMLALLGGTALCGWTGFALSGASAALPSKPAEDANKTATAAWWQAQKGGPLSFFLPQVADSLPEEDEADDADTMMFIAADGVEANATHEAALNRFMRMRMSDPQAVGGQWVVADHMIALGGASAVAGHPQVFTFSTDGKSHGVDLDGDGAVSSDEHEAYLLTLAMRDPAATLAKYPKADEDGDGTLSAVEASNYLSGGFMGGSEAGAFALAAPATPGAGGMFEIKLDLGDKAAGADVQPRMELFMKQLVTDHAAAATEESLRPLIVRALAGASAADSDKTIEVTTDVQCDDNGGVWQIAPKLAERGTITLEMVTKNEESGSDGASAPTLLRMMKKVVMTPGEDGQPVTTVTEQVGDAEPKVTVTRGAVDLHPADEHVTGVPILSDLPVISHLFKAHATTSLPEPPAAWLLQNAGEAPSADEVRKFAGAAGDASLKRFLKMHPRSDANKDGSLTVQERDAYLEKKQSRSRQRMLKRHPEADANGDGLLSTEEMREFFKNRKQGSAAGVQEDVEVEVDGGRAQGVWIRAADGKTGPGAPEVKVIRTNEPNEGPR